MSRPLAILLALCALLIQTPGPARDARALAELMDPFAHPPICSPSGERGGLPVGDDRSPNPHAPGGACCGVCHLPQGGPVPRAEQPAPPVRAWAPAVAAVRPAATVPVAVAYRPHNPRGPPSRS